MAERVSQIAFSIPLVCLVPSLYAKAAQLVTQWPFSLHKSIPDPLQSYLLFNEQGLAYHSANIDGKPLRIDFNAYPFEYRRYFGGGVKEVLAKAVGIKAGVRPRILDVTAGLGSDAFILAALGACVTLVEKSPVVAALLEDGLKRAMLHTETQTWILERMQLCYDEGCKVLAHLSAQDKNAFDTIYLDPMFPAKKKSALVKKEMRILAEITAGEDNSERLFQFALQAMQKQAGTRLPKRIVVKRPHYASYILNKKPDVIYKMKKHRFDVYLCF